MTVAEALKVSEVSRALDGNPWRPTASLKLFKCEVIAYNHTGPRFLVFDEPDFHFRDLTKEAIEYTKIDRWIPE